MKENEQLLSFNKDRYNGYVETINKHASKLVEASEEMRKIGIPKITPKLLLDGKFVDRVLNFYKKEWSSNAAFKHVSFEKYQEFIELDYSKLQLLEHDYNSMKNYSFNFYERNHLYYDYCEHRFRDGLIDAGEKVELKIQDLFEIKGKAIEINLSEEYFKLYTTNPKQILKIQEIEQFIILSREFKASYIIVKEILNNWLFDLNYNLENYQINYYYLLQNIR